MNKLMNRAVKGHDYSRQMIMMMTLKKMLGTRSHFLDFGTFVDTVILA